MKAQTDDFTLAIHQHDPAPADIQNRLSSIENQAAKAAELGAQLLLLPEASLTGYNLPLTTAQSIAITADCETTETLQTVCQTHKIALAYGYIEQAGDALYNAVNVIDQNGKVVAHYRKTHLWGELDRRLFRAGDSFASVFELDGWMLGLLICYDVEFPECARLLALQGAELIMVPTALMAPWTYVADDLIKARAAENQVYMAYANYCGSEYGIDYVGRSCMMGPDGSELARADEAPALLISTLHKHSISSIRKSVPYHQDRRPELYGDLI